MLKKLKIKELDRFCQICGREKGEILHHQNFYLPDDSVLPEEYDIVCCSNCGFVFADTIANQKVYNIFYENFSKYENLDSSISSGGGTTKKDKERFLFIIEIIKKFLPKKETSVLDIGCANGGLLNLMKEEGYINLTGLDPSQNCVNFVKKIGIHCFKGDIFSIKRIFNDKKFDFIILSHVLEHIYDLKKLAKIISKLLNENGILYIETPDAEEYLNHFIVPYYFFDSEHINHFSASSIENLFYDLRLSPILHQKRNLELNNNILYPTVSVMFKKDKKSNIKNLITDFSVKKSILSFVEKSKDRENYSEIKNIAIQQIPVIVWGAGSQTTRLLSNSILKECNIQAFVDSDRKKQGSFIKNIPVYSPEEINNFDGIIIISVALNSLEVLNLVKEMGLNNQTIIIN